MSQTGEVMRLFSYTIILGLLFSTTNSYAQYAYAGAYAGASMSPGSGQWGGMQACPYATAASGVGCSTGRCGGLSKIDQLQAQIDKLDEDISDFEDEQGDLVDGSHDMLGDDRLPFKSGVAKGLAVIEAKRARHEEMPTCDFNTVDPDMTDLIGLIQADPNHADYCVNAGGGAPLLSSNKICNSGFIYSETKGRNSFEKSRKNCDRFLDRYFKLEGRITQAQKKKDKLEDQLFKLQEKEEDRQYKAWDSGKQLPSEGSFCYTCAVGRPEPEAPSWQSILAAGSIDLLNAGVWYAGTRYVSRNNAKLGWATPPLAMGLPGANATASLFANAYGGGYGGGSWGCSPANGYQWGPNGGYGNPYGAMSPYGQCGGAFGAPCGGPGFNVGMGGGIYAPGVGPGGMAGPWGGGGYYPNPYAMGGINMGGGYGAGGYPPGYGGGFGAGIGFGAGAGYGNSPFGILGNGFNPGAGYFPGVYPGGYGMQGGGAFGPMGGGYGYGPAGGLGGIGGGLGLGGGLGYNPYGGIGGPFGGIGGGLGLGGGLGSPFGLGGGLGGGLGSPFGGLGGADYQMQMLNMQMQQYQAAYQAQQRAYQNTQAVTQQIYGLQSEYQQIQQRYQYLMMQLYTGGSVGVGVGYGDTGNMGSVGSGPIPVLNNTGTGSVPTR